MFVEYVKLVCLVSGLSAAHVLEEDDGDPEVDKELHNKGDKLQQLQTEDRPELVPV